MTLREKHQHINSEIRTCKASIDIRISYLSPSIEDIKAHITDI